MKFLEVSLSAKSTNMRKYIKNITIFSIILLVSCQKHTYSPNGIYSEGGIITFSTRVETKAPIITEMNGKHFGVYGYNFSNLQNWNTFRATATPNVFYNLDVSCAQTDGVCSYSVDTDTDINGLEEWLLNTKYSFFAYYPFNTASSSIVLSQKTDIDTPFINYSLPNPTDGQVDPDNLQDIMTAKVTDYSATQGTTVRFTFYHRLFCIDLYGQNFNTDAVTISNLSMTISGIEYDTSKIYMDREIASEPQKTDSWSTSSTLTFPILSSMTLEGKAEAKCLSGDKNIMLIPQDSSIEGASGLNVIIRFTKTSGTESTDVELESNYKVNFKEGKKYSLTINFVGEQVIVVAADAAPWEKKDVTHTFD